MTLSRESPLTIAPVKVVPEAGSGPNQEQTSPNMTTGGDVRGREAAP